MSIANNTVNLSEIMTQPAMAKVFLEKSFFTVSAVS